MITTKNIDDMELFERLNHIVELFESNSQAQLARRVGLLPQTLNNYMNFDGQQKIRKTLLDKILVVYPQLSRDWLFFGEGEMLKTDVHGTPPPQATEQPDSEERIRELKYTIEIQKKLLETYECGLAGNTSVRGTDSAVPVLQSSNELEAMK